MYYNYQYYLLYYEYTHIFFGLSISIGAPISETLNAEHTNS